MMVEHFGVHVACSVNSGVVRGQIRRVLGLVYQPAEDLTQVMYGKRGN